MDAKKFYRSKTFWFNVIAIALAVLVQFGYTGELTGEWAEVAALIVATVNLILRFVTKQPLEK